MTNEIQSNLNITPVPAGALNPPRFMNHRHLGQIARLPEPIRNQVNEFLDDDGLESQRITSARSKRPPRRPLEKFKADQQERLKREESRKRVNKGGLTAVGRKLVRDELYGACDDEPAAPVKTAIEAPQPDPKPQ